MGNKMADVVTFLTECDLHITLSFRRVVDGAVTRDVVIHSAPPRAVTEIVSRFNLVSLASDGLIIPISD